MDYYLPQKMEGTGAEAEVVEHEEATNLTKEKEKEAAGVSKVTDHVAEREGDIDKAQAALSSISGGVVDAHFSGYDFAFNCLLKSCACHLIPWFTLHMLNVLPALACSTLPAEDVTLIVDECDLSKEQAEQLLRRNGGNVRQALKAFIKNAQ